MVIVGKYNNFYKKVDLITDKKLALKVNACSFVLTILFVALVTWIQDFLPTISEASYSGIVEGILLIILMFLITVVHEFIHGLFFKVFTPDKKVSFGFKNGFAYAGSFESIYNKGQYGTIILAPFFMITIVLILTYILGWLSSFQFILLTGVHAGMCTGDFYYILLLLRAPKEVKIEDTSSGMVIYYPE